MTTTAESSKLSADNYLAGEETSPTKHQFIAGEVFAMAGAGEAQVTVAGNLFTLLRNYVRGGPCRAYIADMKVRIEKANAFYYPDVFVTCDLADRRENLFKRNPILVVEVLSDSTAALDRGAKFAHYRLLDSLRKYVLVERERQFVDVFRRDAQGKWVLNPIAEGEEVYPSHMDFPPRCTPLAPDSRVATPPNRLAITRRRALLSGTIDAPRLPQNPCATGMELACVDFHCPMTAVYEDVELG